MRLYIIFPNPTNSEIDITCSFKTKNLQMYDERGALVENLGNINAYSRLIDVRKYAKGNYIVKINNGIRTISKKIIIK